MSLRALVTGGSHGIGFAIASGLHEAGHAVTVLSRTPPEHPSLDHLPCDLRDAERTHADVTAWLASIGDELDVLVHSACAYGATSRHPLLDGTLAEWDAALDVNARGLYVILRAALPSMLRRRRGIVIGMSSDIASAPGPGRIPYAASKAAAHAILSGLAAEVADTGVSVVELAPTMQVDTPGIRSRRPSGFTGEGYANARVFVAPVQWLAAGAAARHHGTCVWVDQAGTCRSANGDLLA